MKPKYIVLIVFIFAACLSGCSVSDRIVYEDSEGVVNESFFDTIKRKQSKKGWIQGQLGSPFQVLEKHDESEIWTYQFTRSRYNRVRALILFSYSAVEQEKEFFHIVFCGDKVQYEWFDEFQSVQVEHLPKRAYCKSNMSGETTGFQPSIMNESDKPHIES